MRGLIRFFVDRFPSKGPLGMLLFVLQLLVVALIAWMVTSDDPSIVRWGYLAVGFYLLLGAIEDVVVTKKDRLNALLKTLGGAIFLVLFFVG